MIKTQVQLEKWQYDQLKALGRERDRSVAALVRESVTLLLSRQPEFDGMELADVAGKYRNASPRGKIKRHDQDWAEAIR